MVGGMLSRFFASEVIARRVTWLLIISIGVLLIFFDGIGQLLMWKLAGIEHILLYPIGIIFFIIGLDIKNRNL
jgi:hypothetical protein